MELIKIEQLATKFKNAIEEARDNGEFDRAIWHLAFPPLLNYFPKGCCNICSDLLAQYLQESRKTNLRIMHGQYVDTPHTWIETDEGYIIDITSGQLITNSLFHSFNIPEIYVKKKDHIMITLKSKGAKHFKIGVL